MKTSYLGVELILTIDKDTGFLEGVQTVDGYQDIRLALSCECLKHCEEQANKWYMDRNKVAYGL